MASLKDGIGAAGKELGAFKKFISRGNVVDMAVGVIIGGAFGKIVTSLVNDIVMPSISILLGKVNFTELVAKVGEVEIKYGKDTYHLSKGDSIYYESIVAHHVHSFGNENAKILAVVYTPA